MQFSLRWLFIAILFLAVSAAALLNANEHWAGAARTAIIVLLSLAAVFAYLASGKYRAFWLGFAVVGTAHFASTRFAAFYYHSNDYNHVVADAAIEWLHGVIAHEERGEVNPIIGRTTLQVEKFRIVARCITVVPLALLGGCIAVWFHSRRNPPLTHADRMSEDVISLPHA